MSAVCIIKAKDKLWLKMDDDGYIAGWNSVEEGCADYIAMFRDAMGLGWQASISLNVIFTEVRFLHVEGTEDAALDWIKTNLLTKARPHAFRISFEGGRFDAINLHQKKALKWWNKAVKPNLEGVLS